VRYFNETLQNDPSISEAVAAIQTLLEVIPRSNGELETVDFFSNCYLKKSCDLANVDIADDCKSSLECHL